MFSRLFRRETAADAIASALYGAIVARARNPLLYEKFGVPDTVSGRFEMVVFHVILVLDRLKTEPEKALGQRIFDLYCKDMDNSLREMGIGDLGVPKRMKKMAEAFYGRAEVYRQALSARDSDGLAQAFARNVFGQETEGARLLAAYGLDAANALARIDVMNAPARFGEVMEAVA